VLKDASNGIGRGVGIQLYPLPYYIASYIGVFRHIVTHRHSHTITIGTRILSNYSEFRAFTLSPHWPTGCILGYAGIKTHGVRK
jgi:hypothetical protein